MDWKLPYQKVEDALELASKWVAFVGVAALAVSYISSGLRFCNKYLQYLQSHREFVWQIVVTVLVMLALMWAWRLNRRFASRFSDTFSGDLRENWDFDGAWRKAEKATLMVTNSDAGGLTKVGADWENYTLTFRARILRTCLGVIIRAYDLNNYYMLQINQDRIRPHRRVAVPVITPDTSGTSDPPKHQVSYQVVWQFFESCTTSITPMLSDWFDTRIVVRGESVTLYINGQLWFQQEAFLKNPVGKIGFRNSGEECALVQNVKVTVDS